MIPFCLPRIDPRAARGAALGVLLLIGASSPLSAQTTPGGPPAGMSGAPADALKQRDQELDAARAKERESAESQAKLRREIDALAADRATLNQQLIDTAARVRGLEASIEATQAHLKPLAEKEAALRKSLEQRQGAVVEILAVLQRVGHQPPPVLFVQPEDALRAVRTAITLGAMVPSMRAEADALAGDLANLVKLRKGIVSEQDRLARDLDGLGRDQLRLNLLIDQRQKKEAASQDALDTERASAAELARQVDTLKTLIAKLESDLPAASRAARAAARAIENDATRPDLAALKDPGRLAPAVAFAATRGHLRWPVNGVKVSDFGASDGLGGTQKGLSIGTRPGAQITSPCDGWVVYAGTFRSYGQLLILNAGGGYHVLLAGMERISVDLGQFVLTGEPVAVMGGGPQVSAAATKSKQPVLYVEFRKDGAPIDPSPWWATNEGEKVRG
jgi:murein hydrolase activator